MSTPQTRRIVKPLRSVEAITVSDKRGRALGNPHFFHMTQEYTLTLECGHQQVRYSCNFDNLNPEELMPKHVRCLDCRGHRSISRHKPKPPPKYDRMASALAAALLKICEDHEQDAVLTWVATHGRYISEDTARARIHGGIALETLDVMVDGRTVKHSDELRDAIEVWAQNPTPGTKDTVRKVSRRLYNSQHAPGNDWFAARALICLGRIASMGSLSADGVIEALTWDRQSRAGFYERLFAAREQLDRSRLLGVTVAEADAPADSRDEGMRQTGSLAQEALDELDRVWKDEYPTVGAHHAPMLWHLLDVYAESARNIPSSPSEGS